MFRGDYLPLCRWPLAWADCETAAGVDGPVWELNGKGEHSSDVESAGYIVPALQLYLSVMQIHTSGQVGSVRSQWTHFLSNMFSLPETNAMLALFKPCGK